MNKKSSIIAIVASFGLALAGCASGTGAASPSQSAKPSTPAVSASASAAASSTPVAVKRIVVGATSIPHAEILKQIVPELVKKGIMLEVKEFSDYTLINTALKDNQIDANFFQHKPYLDDSNQKSGAKLVSIANVHVEPMGAYSKKIKSIAEIKTGAIVGVPNDATNEGRALMLLEKQGLIKLKEGAGMAATPRDIVQNDKKLVFKELEAAQLPKTLADTDFSIINTNYALEGKLDPLKDTIFSEGKESPYANILVVREADKSKPELQELAKALNSDVVKKFLQDKYKGAIIPAF